jgi:hypothetical protein
MLIDGTKRRSSLVTVFRSSLVQFAASASVLILFARAYSLSLATSPR